MQSNFGESHGRGDSLEVGLSSNAIVVQLPLSACSKKDAKTQKRICQYQKTFGILLE